MDAKIPHQTTFTVSDAVAFRYEKTHPCGVCYNNRVIEIHLRFSGGTTTKAPVRALFHRTHIFSYRKASSRTVITHISFPVRFTGHIYKHYIKKLPACQSSCGGEFSSKASANA